MLNARARLVGVCAGLAIAAGACKQGDTALVKDEQSKPADASSAQRTGNGTLEGMKADVESFSKAWRALTVSDDLEKAETDTNAVQALLQGYVARLAGPGPQGEPKLESPGARIIAAQIKPMLKLRGIVWRLGGIVEEKGVDALHSVLVTSLMQVATSARVFAVGENNTQGIQAWRALNRYFTTPFQGVGPRFDSIAQFQKEMMQPGGFFTELKDATDIVAAAHIQDNDPVVWDNQTIFGEGSFGNDPSSSDRFVTLYETDRMFLEAGMHAMQHNALLFAEYNYDDLPKVAAELGHLVGVDGFGIAFGDHGRVNGISALQRAEVICPGRSKGKTDCGTSLFTRRNPGDDTNMKAALAELQTSVKLTRDAWHVLRDKKGEGRKSAGFSLLDPAKILPWQSLNDLNIDNIANMLTDDPEHPGNSMPVHSVISGKPIVVNIKAFYLNPNVNKDLKIFLPTAFVKGEPRVEVAGQSRVRNYEFGMSSNWNEGAFKEIFPDIKTGTDVPVVMKQLAQTWGGWFAATPLAAVSMVF